jgi:hydroxymethylpyrimidine/phosphomethylpyrimidine kinase
MVATSGDRLIDEDAIRTLTGRLFPLAAVVTPNRDEAEVLADRAVKGLSDADEVAAAILAHGPGAVLVKGIPDGRDMVDFLATPEETRELRRPALDTGATHGTGCTLSSAIAAALALGHGLDVAVEMAKGYVWRAMEAAFPVGGGSLPLNHLVAPEAPET